MGVTRRRVLEPPVFLGGAGSSGRPRSGGRPMSTERVAQLEYSEFQGAMLDEEKRRRKAAKILAVLAHYLGRDAAEPGSVLSGLTVADIGCSAGFIADELAGAGASRTFGVDIDVP